MNAHRLSIFLLSMAMAAAHAATSLNAATPLLMPCTGTVSNELRIYVINEAAAAPRTLDVAAAEASGIWARVGLRLTWAAPPASPSTRDGRTVVVVVRRGLKQQQIDAAADSKGRRRSPLGRLAFDVDGRPGNFIEVSFDAITKLVRKGSYIDKPIAGLPQNVQDPMLGRGLGRVIAHELGHWFIGRGHVRTGVMKASFGVQDLTDARVPQLPDDWTSARTEERLEQSSPCVPPALHQLASN